MMKIIKPSNDNFQTAYGRTTDAIDINDFQAIKGRRCVRVIVLAVGHIRYYYDPIYKKPLES